MGSNDVAPPSHPLIWLSRLSEGTTCDQVAGVAIMVTVLVQLVVVIGLGERDGRGAQPSSNHCCHEVIDPQTPVFRFNIQYHLWQH